MILEQLKNNEQKEAFARLAYLVAKADGGISLADMTLIDLFGVEAANLKTQKTDQKEIQKLCAVFNEPIVKELIFSNLLSIAYIEKYENQNQLSLLKKIRESLGINMEQEERFRNWIKIIQGDYFPIFAD